MTQKKHIGKKILSIILTLAMVVGLMPGMSLTALATGEKAYAAYDVTSDTNKNKSVDDLTALQVTFNGKKWYIIEDNSSSATSGTVTLLSADTTFGTKKFAEYYDNKKYSTSQVKDYLDSMTETGGAFVDVADAIETVNLTTNKYDSDEEYETVNGVKLYLLSTEEAKRLPENVLKAGFTGGDCEDKEWWLRSPGIDNDCLAFVNGVNGNVCYYADGADYVWGVRPALQLDLSKVVFDSTNNSFNLKPHEHGEMTFEAWNSLTSLPDTAGNYYLGCDVTLQGEYNNENNPAVWTVPSGTTNLCLNGHSISITDKWSWLEVPNGSTLNLYDDGETGTVIQTDPESVEFMFVVKGGQLNLYSGTLRGALTVLNKSGTFNMAGGNVQGSTSAVVVESGVFSLEDGQIKGTGQGVGVGDSGNFIMSGGKITGSSSDLPAVGVSGTFTMSGDGEICNNDCPSNAGGTVSVGGTFNMKGGSIYGNTAGNGGGIGVVRNGTFNLTGGSIYGNTAENGGGVYAYVSSGGDYKSHVNITGGSITGNNATSWGGGIYGAENVYLSGSPQIHDNYLNGQLSGSVYEKGDAGANNNLCITNSGDGDNIDYFNVNGGLSDARVGLNLPTEKLDAATFPLVISQGFGREIEEEDGGSSGGWYYNGSPDSYFFFDRDEYTLTEKEVKYDNGQNINEVAVGLDRVHYDEDVPYVTYNYNVISGGSGDQDWSTKKTDQVIFENKTINGNIQIKNTDVTRIIYGDHSEGADLTVNGSIYSDALTSGDGSGNLRVCGSLYEYCKLKVVSRTADTPAINVRNISVYGATLELAGPAGGSALRSDAYISSPNTFIYESNDGSDYTYHPYTSGSDTPIGNLKQYVKINHVQPEASITTAPTIPIDAVDGVLAYSGNNKALVTAGSDVTGGTLKYALGADKSTVPDDDSDAWIDSPPEEKDPGTYYVWYKVFGEGGYKDTDPHCIEVSIFAPVEIQNGDTVTPYVSFDAAVNAWMFGNTLRLLTDIQTSSTVTITGGNSSSPKILDLNGYGILNTNGGSVNRVIQIGKNTQEGHVRLIDSHPEREHYIKIDSNAKRATGVDETTEVTWDKDLGTGVIKISGGYIAGGHLSNSDFGSGVLISNGSFTMEGGNIVGNYTAYYGAGISVSKDTEFIMKGGNIIANNAKNSAGGVFDAGYFEMSGGSITQNRVSAEGSSTGRSSGVEVDGYSEATFKLTGGSITENISTYPIGSGIYLLDNAKLYISGNPVVKDNKGETYNRDVAVKDGKYIYVDGELTEGAHIGVWRFSTNTVQTAQDYPGTFTSGYKSGGTGESAYSNDDDPSKYFFSDSGWPVLLNESNEATTIQYVTLAESGAAISIQSKGTGNTAGDDVMQIGDVLKATPNPEDADDPSYQWYRVDDSTDPETEEKIEGATNSSYSLTAVDYGKKIKVVISQTTDAGGKPISEGEMISQTAVTTTKVTKKTPSALSESDAKAHSGINYISETVSPDSGYEISLRNTGDDPAASTSSIAELLGSEGEQFVYIRSKETDDTEAGAWVAVKLATRPDAPTGLTTALATDSSTSDGKIIGMDNTMQYSGNNGTTWNDAENSETSVISGEYLVRFKATASYPAGKAATVTVGHKETINLTDAQKPKARTGLEYNGDDQALIENGIGIIEDGELQYAIGTDDSTVPTSGWEAGIPAKTDAGPYYVWYKVKGDENHNDTEPICLPVTIAKQPAAPSELTDKQKPAPNTELIYSAEPQGLVNKPTKLPEGYTGVQYRLSDEDGWSDKLPTGMSADTYTVQVKYVGDSNHEDFIGDPIKVTIAKANVTITANDKSKTYGQEDPILDATVTGLFGSDTVEYTVAREEGESVRTYTITPSGEVTQGNYTVTYETGTFNITSKSSDDENITAEQKDGEILTYIGESVKPTIIIKDGDKTLVEGKDYTVTYEGIEDTNYPGTGDGKLPPTNAGKYKAIITFKGNYTGTRNVTFDIGKASPDVKTLPTVSAITYGQKLSDSTITGGEMKGQSVEKVDGKFTWEDSTVKPAVADSEKTEYTLIFTPDNQENYGPVKVKVKVKVNGYKEDKDKCTSDQKPTAIEGLIYNGNEQILVNPPENLPEGYTKVQYRLSDEDEWSEELPKGKAAGTYKVQVKYIGDENHVDFEGDVIDATISPKTSGEDITAKQKDGEILTYTGESVKPTIIITDGTDENKKELVEGTDYTVIYEGVEPTVYPGEGGDNTKAPAGAGKYKAVITFKDNYTGTKEVEFTIAKSGQEAPDSGTFTVINAEDAENTNGKIDGFDKEKTYQYSSDDGKTWTDVPKGAASIDVKAGTYKIRFVGDDNHEPSEAVKVTVGIASRTQGVVNFNKDEASGSEAYVETVVEEAKSSNIENFAESQVEEGKDVKVELEITPKKEDDVDKASVTEIGGAVDEVFTGIETESIVTEYLQIDLAKYVDNAKEGNISDTKSPLEIELTYDETKAGNPIVVRTHNGKAKAFGKLKERPENGFKDATYYAVNGKIYLYSQYFSDFAIVYSTKKTYYVNVDLGNGDTLSQVVGENSKLDLPTGLTKEGFAFGGWYKDAEYNNAWDVDKDTVTGDISIYGKWNKSVTGVKVDVDNVTFNKTGESTKLNVSVTPSDAADKKVTFSSSDPKVVTVDENGNITAVANGTATITVTTEDGAKTATVKVTVAIPDVDKKGATENQETADKSKNTDQQKTTDQQTVEPTKEEKAAISMNAGLKISQTGSKINIKWGKVKEADGYDLYVTYCGESFAHKKPAKTFDKNTTVKSTITKINGKKINLKKNFKLYVAAYKMTGGKKEILAKTITGHVVGRKNTKYSNAKNIKITSKTKVSIKQGKTSKIKAKTVLVSKGKKQLSDAHAKEFRYASSNNSIATVDKNGKIKGIAKGTCTIYVYSRNGYAKKVSVTVK